MVANRKIYPFTAIVGQEKMKKALILNIINPGIGGVLIRGEKGTAKSTAVRALAELLPEREKVKGCIFGCDPYEEFLMCDDCLNSKIKGILLETEISKMSVVDLPVSATEDRVVGTLDIEHAIKKGEKRFEPGILALANRNILYVDEINLLDDHIVDVLLDCAAMGINTVEREGVSFSHPSRFILVGTMNPEEGDLRPQLLDRFGLVVDVEAERDIDKRVQVISRRIEFENNPQEFSGKYSETEQALKDTIIQAQTILNEVKYDDSVLESVAKIAVELGVDGHRADIAMLKTAITIAAFNLRKYVEKSDIIEAAQLVSPHRMRRKPFEQESMPSESIKQLINDMQNESQYKQQQNTDLEEQRDEKKKILTLSQHTMAMM